MRKALVVLLLLVTVIGMVFAGNDETSQPNTNDTLTLIMMIGEKPPVFNLRASSGSITVSTNSGSAPAPFYNGASYVTELTLTDDISMKSISQTFEIFSAAKANVPNDSKFEFTVEATPFKSQDSATGTTYETKGNISYSYEAADVSGSNITVTSDGDRITATFTGPQVRTDIKIGQIVVTWPKDSSAIPAEYVSDVTMTVQAK